MGVDMLVFAALASRYKYAEETIQDPQHQDAPEKGHVNDGFSSEESKL